MNCQQTQDLLPVYVGGELEEDRARLVATHVQDCETCSDVAREYRETRQLLQTFVPPAFTENFYAEMRQSVWQNVEKKSGAPAFSSIIGDLFRPRLAWALATAILLIAVSAVGIYVVYRRGATPERFVSNLPSPTHPATDESSPTSARNDNASWSSSSRGNGNSRRASVPIPNSRPKHNPIQDSVNLAAISVAEPVSPSAISATESGDSSKLSYGSADTHTPLRLEIQTKNPNIRIIWFTPRDAKSSSPNSKGT